VRARVFDIRGRLVRTMDLSESTQGVSEVSWDGNDGNGRRSSPGVYFAALTDDAGARATVKITILR
jgi:flagellar hook assembly protein FlgD